MSIQSKLCNPTPFNVSLPYERGIKLKIPADGVLELTMRQLDDYISGKPGSEEVRKTLDFYGLFLRDPDLSFDLQALQALQASYDAKKYMKDQFIRSAQKSRTQAGIVQDEETMTDLLNSHGYGPNNLGGEIDALAERIKFLKERTDQTKRRVIDQLDPDLTCFGTQPPRPFESKLLL